MRTGSRSASACRHEWPLLAVVAGTGAGFPRRQRTHWTSSRATGGERSAQIDEKLGGKVSPELKTRSRSFSSDEAGSFQRRYCICRTARRQFAVAAGHHPLPVLGLGNNVASNPGQHCSESSTVSGLAAEGRALPPRRDEFCTCGLLGITPRAQLAEDRKIVVPKWLRVPVTWKSSPSAGYRAVPPLAHCHPEPGLVRRSSMAPANGAGALTAQEGYPAAQGAKQLGPTRALYAT